MRHTRLSKKQSAAADSAFEKWLDKVTGAVKPVNLAVTSIILSIAIGIGAAAQSSNLADAQAERAAAKHFQHSPKQQRQAKARTGKKNPHAAVDAYQACLADASQEPETCWALQPAAYAESHPQG